MTSNNSVPPAVLLVSADGVLQTAIQLWRKRNDARLVVAESGAEAAQLLRDMRFISARLDALIVDYTLPDTSGCAFIGLHRDDFPNIAVALATTYRNPSLMMWGRAFQATVLLKPLSEEALHTVLLRPGTLAGPNLTQESMNA